MRLVDAGDVVSAASLFADRIARDLGFSEDYPICVFRAAVSVLKRASRVDAHEHLSRAESPEFVLGCSCLRLRQREGEDRPDCHSRVLERAFGWNVGLQVGRVCRGVYVRSWPAGQFRFRL